MSTFTCEVVEAQISPHPNADAIEICNIGLFQSIVRKDLLKTGDLCVYIPEASICPESVMRFAYCWDEEKNRGKLTGSGNNRVKACKLRGVLSQGLIIPLSSEVKEFYSIPNELVVGQDLQVELGVEKYVPVVPSSFFGPNQPKIAGAYHGYTPAFDVENLKKYKKAFVEDEFVSVTEKIHGTCCVIGAFTDAAIERFGFKRENLYKERIYVGTKSLTKRGIVYNPNDDSFIYSKVPKDLGILDALDHYIRTFVPDYLNISSVVFVGEIFGPGVQKGFNYGQTEKTFRLFEILVSYLNDPSRFYPIPYIDYCNIVLLYSLPTVPLLYSGPYRDWLISLNSGMSTMDESQIREGIVIRSCDGNKLLKYVSEAYLLRKGDVTEYE